MGVVGRAFSEDSPERVLKIWKVSKLEVKAT